MNRVTDFVIRRPRSVLAVWALLFVTGGFLALQLDSALSGGGFTNPRAEALIAQETLEADFDEAPNQLVLVIGASDAIPSGDIVAAVEIARDHGADSFATPDDQPSLASDDGHTVAVIAGFTDDGTTVQNVVPELQSALDEADIAGDVYVTGQPALDYQLNAHSKADAVRAEMIVFPLLLAILLIVFGSVVATLLPLLVAGSSLAIAMGIGTLTTTVTDLSNLYTNIVSMIGLALAVDYSLFIIKRFREELALGRSVPDAIRITMATAGHSVLFSGIAVALAMSALLIPQVMALTSIALGGIVVSIAALLVTMLALPAALMLLGTRIDAWRVPLPRRRRTNAPATASGTSVRTSRIRRPGLVGLAGVAVMLIAALPVLGLSLQSPVASATVLPADDPARQGLDVLEEQIGQTGFFPVDVIVAFPAGTDADEAVATTAAAAEWLAGRDGVDEVVSVAAFAAPGSPASVALQSGEVPEVLERLWHEDGGEISTRLLVTTSEGPDSVSAHDLVHTVRAELADELDASVAVSVTGATAQGVDFDETIIGSLPLVAAVVLVLTFAMLAFAWRSLVLPALALGFNLLVVGASLGILTLLQQALSPSPLNSVTPILLFAVMFGLSMDYMVIIMARMRELYRAGMPYDQAVLDGAARTRSMINSAALIMVAVFVSFMSAQISIVREIGIGLAIAVTLDAIVIRMIVMPSVLRAIGPRAFGRRSPAVLDGDEPSREPNAEKAPALV